MTNTSNISADTIDFVVILSWRIDRKSVQKGFAFASGILSPLN
jgi:hypothetical protein